ncbi:hypothetical protein [Hoeflea olei]|uniref:Uncharacterized protein n=1 Tax=Hoeflea olei TaxID=1480615 RepID=A0A1C1Z0I2_9HYPH|nr:hypothetical protein AWJ14_08805 [Hoeflea olei]
MTDPYIPRSSERRLADIVREVKIAAADRTDVVVDMRDADRARLELLAQEIKPLFDDIDPADDRFDFGISPGLQPRLWIDSVAHVHMGRDRRVYVFVRDTRLGRVIISDTSDMSRTADAVGRYIAERVIERERILSGDFEALKAANAGSGEGDVTADEDLAGEADEAAAEAKAGARAEDASAGETRDAGQPAQAPMPARVASYPATSADTEVASLTAAPRAQSRGSGFVLGASWFILGCVAGAAALVGAFWDRLSAMIN